MAGGELCWRGDLLWENASGRFDVLAGPSCRPIQQADAGKRIFGVAIDPDSLAMRLSPPFLVGLQRVNRVGQRFFTRRGLDAVVVDAGHKAEGALGVRVHGVLFFLL